MTLPEYRGIAGLEGREPVGAVLTIGVKGPRGNPTDTDRFHLVVPTMGADGRRALHPDFKRWHAAPIDHRQVVHANLVHVTEEDAWGYRLKAQVLPGDRWPAHPDKRPACEGDGVTATRYFGETGTDDFREIPCPNEACEFRQGKPKPCGAFGTLYFRIRWPEGVSLPSPLVKWSTASWNSVRNVEGFFEHVRTQAEELGVESPSLYGLSFSMTLSRKTKPSERAAFPVVSISPECDLVDFFLAQRRRRAELGGGELKLLPAGARDPEESTPEEAFADFATITPGHVKKPSSGVTEEPGGEVADEAEIVEEAETEAKPDPEPVPDAAVRWDTLRRKAKALGLSESDVDSAVAAVTDGGIFPDLDPADDGAVEAELQKMARAKR